MAETDFTLLPIHAAAPANLEAFLKELGAGEAEVDREAAGLLSSRRSGSVPVRALIRVDLPWST